MRLRRTRWRECTVGVFDAAISRLAEPYEKVAFYAERDAVFFVHTTMVSLLAETHPQRRVFDDARLADRLRADLAGWIARSRR